MAESNSTVIDDAMRIARRMALSFRLRDDDVDDAVSTAWMIARRGTSDDARTIAWDAVWSVRCQRTLSRSKRSIGMRKDGPQRSGIDVADLGGRADPADIATVRIDWAAFRQSLTSRNRRALDLMVRGEGTLSIAGHLKMSPARVSQLRREFVEQYLDFVAD